MTSAGWTSRDIPPLDGALAVVTGANSGLGLETARALAERGATVILACRSQAKAEAAIETLARAGVARERLEFRACDLSSLDSIRACAAELGADPRPIDLLINNAGVMALPRSETRDGFEMQIGTNHFGHFALTGLLWPQLAAGARVVTVASLMHRVGRIRFDDLHGQRRYDRWLAYGQSKLANLLFCFELQRRLAARGRPMTSVAAHPGYAKTNLLTPGLRRSSSLAERITNLGDRLIAQGPDMGALPTLYAATMPDVRGGDYYGPGGVSQLRGPPRRVAANARAHDRAAAARLWDTSVELTGVDFGGL